jgi:hypothetical protein
MRRVVVKLFNVEKNYVERLVGLDEVVDKLIRDKFLAGIISASAHSYRNAVSGSTFVARRAGM